MEYRQIVSVTGLGGLYQLISTKNDGAIVRSLTDQSVKFVSARIHQITPLESIEIYTYNDNVRLHEVLEGILRNDEDYCKLNVGKADSNALKAFFKKALPEFDEERVYVSDIKKILKWYGMLKANDLLHFEAYHQEETTSAETVSEQETTSENPEAAVAEAVKEEPEVTARPAKKVGGEAPAEDGATEKPTKKTASKKTAEKKVSGSSAKKPAKKATAKKKGE